MEKTNRIIYFDYLRIFAIFAVMILHISAQNWYTTDVSSFEWQVFNFFNSAVHWCVPVFVMISGSLFLSKEIPIKTVYSKYILRLVVSFVIWSAIYACFTGNHLIDRLYAFVRGHYHMWFIFMIIGLYICIPLIKPIAYDKNKSKYFLSIALIFVFVIPEVITLTKDFSGVQINTIADIIEKDISDMKMNIVLGYTSYFIFGYVLNKVSLKKRHRIAIYLLGLGSFVTSVVLNFIVALKTQTACGHYSGGFTINTLLETTAIFIWFKHRQYSADKKYVVIQNLSKYSFGAYLVHVLIIEQLEVRFGLNTLSFNPILSILCLCVIVFTGSFFISAILNNIPLVKRYIV